MDRNRGAAPATTTSETVMKRMKRAFVLAALSMALTAAPALAKTGKFFLVAKGGKGPTAWRLYRGSRIRHASDLRWLKSKGVTRVVALENWNHKSLMRAAKRLHMEYLPRFMSTGRPHELGRRRFGENVTDDLVVPGKNTYVYCTYGVHRTGGVVGRFRAEHGWGCDQILAEANHYGFHKNKYRKYHFLIDWIMRRCRQNGKAAQTNGASRSSRTGTTGSTNHAPAAPATPSGK